VHARAWLFSLETIGIKLGLSQITRLLEILGHPERAYRTVTVAGTNGKGSVTAMIERGLRAAGRRTGRYTSPHLVSIEERIAINGLPIAAETFDALAERVRHAAATFDSPPSFFEATTALALLAFQEAGVTDAVLEVGLGGRLDATNVVDSPVVAITSIALDHQEYLGTTLAEIAREKAGIIKPGAVVIVGTNPPEVLEVIGEVAAEREAMVIHALVGVRASASASAQDTTLHVMTVRADYGECALRLVGRHQVANAVIAVRVLESLPDVSADAIRTAMSDVEWPARLEWLRWIGHDILLDGAHNPAGAQALASFLEEMVPHPVPIVIGVMRDKAAEEIVRALARRASLFVATAAPSPRAMDPAALGALCRATGVTTVEVDEPGEGVAMAARHGEPVVIAGSLYLAGHVRSALLGGA
jgi:dihydrofolate synthase / folylpolyglutamate synthase